MSKISQYLNEHLLGEVITNDSVLERFSRDGSVLNIKPEMVVNPKVTNDIRKVARFTWQLAEKGHVMPITVRGGGTDLTGASIGKGIILNMASHLNNIIFASSKTKEQFAHVQPGVNFKALNDAIRLQDQTIPVYPASYAYSTIGGAIANNSGGLTSGKYGLVGDRVTRLEIVLANGDLIETQRINKRDLEKKKGLQTMEGDIYRKIDGLIEDNKEVINNKIANYERDNLGYSGIDQVKKRDGSFDLTPLFIGSQGTLGIVSEIVLKTETYISEETVILASFANSETARDAADMLVPFQPVELDLIDGKMIESAQKIYGKKYLFTEADMSDGIGAVIFASFRDSNERNLKKTIKLALKKLAKVESTIYTSDNYSFDDLYAVRDCQSLLIQPEAKGDSMPLLIDGAAIPATRREEFITLFDELTKKHHVEAPYLIQWLDGVVRARFPMQLHQVGDKQKVLKFIHDYIDLVVKCDGGIVSESGEGRLKANAAGEQTDDDVAELYKQIRQIFNPFGTLNPGVKETTDVRELISALNPDFNLADFSILSLTE
jgi:FAD/FMN-containing dehydrogenase